MNNIIIEKIEKLQKDVNRLQVMQSNINNYVYEQPYFINEIGTITVNGTNVTGIGTSFTSSDVGRDVFWSPSTGVFVWVGRILTFISETSVTLSSSYSGSAITNQLFHLSTTPGLGTILYPSTLTVSRQTVAFTANVAQTITWQFLTRNTTNAITQVPFPITLPTTQIVIPQAGYYMITLYTSYSVATQAVMQISINGAFPTSSVGSVASGQLHSFSAMQYFEQNDYFEINLRYTVTGTLQTNNERTVNQSPYLYVARIS